MIVYGAEISDMSGSTTFSLTEVLLGWAVALVGGMAVGAVVLYFVERHRYNKENRMFERNELKNTKVFADTQCLVSNGAGVSESWAGLTYHLGEPYHVHIYVTSLESSETRSIAREKFRSFTEGEPLESAGEEWIKIPGSPLEPDLYLPYVAACEFLENTYRVAPAGHEKSVLRKGEKVTYVKLDEFFGVQEESAK